MHLMYESDIIAPYNKLRPLAYTSQSGAKGSFEYICEPLVYCDSYGCPINKYYGLRQNAELIVCDRETGNTNTFKIFLYVSIKIKPSYKTSLGCYYM